MDSVAWDMVDKCCPEVNATTLYDQYSCDICGKNITVSPWKRCYWCDWDCCAECLKFQQDYAEIHGESNACNRELTTIPKLEESLVTRFGKGSVLTGHGVREVHPVVFSLRPVERVVPQVLAPYVTTETAARWLRDLEDVCEVEGPVVNARGWAYFADWYKHPMLECHTNLLVCCEPGDCYGQIAIVVSDYRGHIYVNVKFRSIAEYLAAVETWERIRPNEEKRLRIMEEYYEDDADSDSECAEDLALMCCEFSGYAQVKFVGLENLYRLQ